MSLDAHVGLEHPVHRQVLAEGARAQVRPAQLARPGRVVVVRVDVDGLVDPAVDGEVGLAVAFQAELVDEDAAGDRRLDDAGGHLALGGRERPREADVDGAHHAER